MRRGWMQRQHEHRRCGSIGSASTNLKEEGDPTATHPICQCADVPGQSVVRGCRELQPRQRIPPVCVIAC